MRINDGKLPTKICRVVKSFLQDICVTPSEPSFRTSTPLGWQIKSQQKGQLLYIDLLPVYTFKKKILPDNQRCSEIIFDKESQKKSCM